MALYIVQFSLFLAVFYVAYLLFLKKETFFNYNRIYLLLTPCLALLLPFITLDFLRPKDSTGTAFINLPPVLLGDFAVAAEETQAVTHNLEAINWNQILWQNGFLILYGIGFSIALLLLIKKWNQFRKFKISGIQKQQDGIFYSEIQNSRIACTFYNQIFIGSEINEKERQHILQHEWVHVTQNHSLDLLFFEILKLLFWFHPAVFAYQKQITSLHEFIADEHVTQNTSKINYYQSLLNVAFGTHQISFINQFFNHSLIKKRIVMLQKSKSAAQAKLKYLIVLPLIAAMLTYVSCSENEETVETNQSELPAPPPPPAPPTELLLPDETENYGVIEVEDINNLTDDENRRFRELSKKIIEDKVMHKLVITDGENKKVYDFDKNSNIETDGVPFSSIETVPAYPGCDLISNNETIKDCTSSLISQFVNSTFNTKAVEKFAKKGSNKIYVKFTISKTGNIEDIKARAASPELAEEAKRVVAQLPKMQPGIQDGKPVNVLYSLPIIFKIH